MPERPATPEQTIQRLREGGWNARHGPEWLVLLDVAEAARVVVRQPWKNVRSDDMNALADALARLAGERPA